MCSDDAQRGNETMECEGALLLKAEDDEVYNRLATQIAREDGLVGTRIAWTLSFQGLLFAALAFAAKPLPSPPPELKSSDALKIRSALLDLIPVVGIVSSALCLIGVFAALRQLSWLRATYDRRFKEREELYVRPTGFPGNHILGNLTPLALPALLAAAWIYLMVRGS